MRIQSNINQPNSTLLSYRADNKVISSVQKGSEIINSTLTDDKKTPLSAISVAALTAVCSVVMLSRGSQKNINTLLNKIKNFLEEKATFSSINGSKRTRVYDFSAHKINSFIKKTESINNITSLKDILFMKAMYKTDFTKKIHDSITKYFEDISKKTVLNSYKKTGECFEMMYKIFDELDDSILKNSADDIVEYKGKEYTKKELVKQARSLRGFVKVPVNAFIDKKTIETRYNYIKQVTSSLYSSFWNASFKDFWSKNNKFKNKEMWQTFIAAEQIKGNQTKLATWIAVARNEITFTKSDQMNNIYQYLKAIGDIISPQDKEGVKIIKKLEWIAQNPNVFQSNQDLFFKELKKLEEHKLIKNIKNESEQAIEDYKNTNIELIHRQISEDYPGALQDMLDIYYKISPFGLRKTGALLAAQKAIKSFDESVELECVQFFDKMRDLKLGSAPTDVLTILFSFLGLSYGLGHAKDKDKKVAVVLKSGIPIAGGIAVAMFSAAKLVSGGKSLALGFLSGIFLNRLGVIANSIYKQNR